MFIFSWVSTVITLAAGLTGFLMTRRFVARRLRFVDAVYSPAAPFIIAAIAMLLAWPVSALPLVTATASALFGIGAGLGTMSGVKALRRVN
jgi:CHASE2 domain-containing sensor protein